MANVLTGIRILCGALILCFPAFSGRYFLFYLLGGLTDAVDGTVARKTGTASAFGSAFDTAADLVFTAAVAIRILPALRLPSWVLSWIAVIALFKIGCHAAGSIAHYEFRTVHSTLNRVCGGAVYLAALLIGIGPVRQAATGIAAALCVPATIAAIAEGITLLKKNR